MLVFGDGYYWSKTGGSSIFEKSQWVQGPGWGRRKRRSIEPTDAPDTSLAEQIFNALDISDDTCRKWVVYAPTGWTVALYIWYMVKLGFILAALLLLLFAKKWNARQEPIILAGSPEYFHHRSLDGLDLLQHGSLQEATLFWRDRMEALREKLE
uniref:Uncharacterized protein n=1 Tax=Anopheles albimanus TaxID=7167 RepID=A0A182FHL4_ANOAL